MKKRILLTVFGIMISCGFLYAQALDQAIRRAADAISANLPAGSTVAVGGFKSSSTRLNEHVIQRMNAAIANNGKLTLVEREDLDLVWRELDLNMNNEWDPKTAQRVGNMIGAKYIITGSLSRAGKYFIYFRPIVTETGVVQSAYDSTIDHDKVLESLTGWQMDFSTGERMGASFLNLFLGAGSFLIERDYWGGGITGVAEALGAVLFISSLTAYNQKYPDGKHYEYITGTSIEKDVSLLDSDMAGPFFAGIGLYAAGAVFGIIRASVFHKPGSPTAYTPLDGLRIGIAPDARNNPGFQLGYTLHF